MARGLDCWAEGMEVEASHLYHKSFFFLHLFFFLSSQPVRQCFLLGSIPGWKVALCIVCCSLTDWWLLLGLPQFFPMGVGKVVVKLRGVLSRGDCLWKVNSSPGLGHGHGWGSSFKYAGRSGLIGGRWRRWDDSVVVTDPGMHHVLTWQLSIFRVLTYWMGMKSQKEWTTALLITEGIILESMVKADLGSEWKSYCLLTVAS